MEIFEYNYVDLIVLILLVITSLIGASNGFIKEFLNFCVWTLSIIFALFLSNSFINFYLLELNIIISIMLFFVLFTLCFITFQIFNIYFFSDLNIINNGFLNKFLGFIFGLMKGSLLIFLIISGMIYLFYTTKDFPIFFEKSIFFETIKIYSIKVIEKIVNFI
ncbi:MAG: hypothetical protein CMN44_07220 [SAR116 cluster bacterium]|nr:hypothetical protein [SAR116 cluster bacterium]RPH09268.1 MAG: CvpA family protein [Alphaproteobacteria bacterium TMED54]|tara:strand:+ start:196 stop:684 length:489 start_codon:yes stop_codon:yes gene_type:complete